MSCLAIVELALGRLDLVGSASSSRRSGSTTSSAYTIVAIPEHVRSIGADRHELLLGADHDVRDADLAGLAHRLEQQPVRLRAAGAGREVVGVVVVDRVDLGESTKSSMSIVLRLLRARASSSSSGSITT